MAKDSTLVNVQLNDGSKARIYVSAGVAEDVQDGKPAVRMYGQVSIYVGSRWLYAASIRYCKTLPGLADIIAEGRAGSEPFRVLVTAIPGGVYARAVSTRTGALLFEDSGSIEEFEQGWERVTITAGLQAEIGDRTMPPVVDPGGDDPA